MDTPKLNKRETRLILGNIEWALSLVILNGVISQDERFRNNEVRIYINESLMYSFLVRVTKLFDISYKQKNLTVFSLLPEKCFSASELETIKQIKRYRDKHLGHNDKKTAVSLSSSVLLEGLTPQKIIKLLQKSCELLKTGYNAKEFIEKRKSVFQKCLATI